MPINYEDYPDDWPAISAKIRFGRARGICEGTPRHPECRAKHAEPHPETGSKVVLTVAHLCGDDCSEGKGGKNCGDPSHLRALCQRCHLSLDIDHHVCNAAETRRQQEIEAGQTHFLGMVN